MLLFLFTVLTIGFVHGDGAAVYHATLAPIGGGGQAGGPAYVYIYASGDGVSGYYELHVNATEFPEGACNDNETNACGAHIHSGSACDTKENQGGHYFEGSADPWLDVVYEKVQNGTDTFNVVEGTFKDITIGAEQVKGLSGKAFIVHDEGAARKYCGLLEPIEFMTATLTQLGSTGVSGEAAVWVHDKVKTFAFGTGTGLTAGEECQGTKNFCGAHIHKGYACDNSTSQDGHFYDTDLLQSDPWVAQGYEGKVPNSTKVWWTVAVETGLDSSLYVGKPFVLHNNQGTAGDRVACGIIGESPAPEPTSTSAPTSDANGITTSMLAQVSFALGASVALFK